MDEHVLWSYIFSILSIVFYSVVYFPQFNVIYKTKSVEGLSVWMFLLWSQADFLSLIGTILLEFEQSIVLMGYYHIFTGFLMVSFVLYYDKDASKNYKILYTVVYYILNISIVLSLNIIKYVNWDLGQILGWITTVLYIIGRFPQIILNFKNKSIEDVSVLMYVLTICGNTCYTLSVITLSTEYEYIMLNLAWIMMTIVTILLDLFVIYQCKIYKNHKVNDIIV